MRWINGLNHKLDAEFHEAETSLLRRAIPLLIKDSLPHIDRARSHAMHELERLFELYRKTQRLPAFDDDDEE